MIIPLISAGNGKYFVILQSEAEEEASSAEEQLASNRFLRHTEIVVWALSFGAAPIILGDAVWLRKTYQLPVAAGLFHGLHQHFFCSPTSVCTVSGVL